MADLPKHLTFKAWQRSKLFERAERKNERLESAVTLKLTDSNGDSARGTVSFTLMAAGDVAGIKLSAIKHLAPAPFTQDAETTKFVHIEFWEDDLPWRYTPQRPDGNKRLKPWLVLLVGTSQEIEVEAGIVKTVEDEVLRKHDLNNSPLWAHSQLAGNNHISRILSPRSLKPQYEHVAVLVPAFNAKGNPMWSVNGDVVTKDFGDKGLPAFYSWKFWSAEAGDFATLAAALTIPKGVDVGKANLHYRRKVLADGINLDETMEMRGAITSLQDEDEADTELLHKVFNDVDQLNNVILENDTSDEAIGLPHYGRPWLPNPDDFDSGWPWRLSVDPRGRAICGLGTWMGVEGQEALMDAAVKQAGALREAGQRINHLALGVWAAGRLWERRLPTNENERLRILGPMLARIVSEDGGIALDQVTSGSSPLPAAIFSSLAQRMLRQRSTHTRHIREGDSGFNYAKALKAANQPEPMPERAPAGLPHVDAIARDMGLPTLEDLFELDHAWIEQVLQEVFDKMRSLIAQYRGDRDQLLEHGQEGEIPTLRHAYAEQLFNELATQLDDHLHDRGLPCSGFELNYQDLPGGIERYIERLLEDDSAQRRLYELLRRQLRRCMIRRICPDTIDHLNLPYELRLISVADIDEIDDRGRSLVIVALVGTDLYIRIFGASGTRIVDKEEDELDDSPSLTVTEFKQRLTPLPRESDLSQAERQIIINDATLLAGHRPYTFCDDLADLLPPMPRQEEKPIDLGVLSKHLVAHLDPRKPNAPARRRLCARLHGIDCSRLIPPEFAVGLDFPTWDLLRKYDNEWLLPGVNALPKDSITALRTNPIFIDAYMVGINSQFMAEMRWRDLAVDRKSTPLRMFWGQVNYATQKRVADIQPLAEWAKEPDKPLGDLTHQTIQPDDPNDNTNGNRLVIVFRSDLFRRYPSTLVYLVKPKPQDVQADAQQPDDESTELNKLLKDTPKLDEAGPDRRYFGPIFPGRITPEVTFFIFDVKPGDLDQYWLVLDEPPIELRFGNDKGDQEDRSNAAKFAASTIDQPFRVAISGKELKAKAEQV